MQDPQSYEDDAGNVYVQEGNRWRVIRPGAAATPAAPAPQAIPGLIPMQSPSDRRAEESLRLQQETAAFQRERAMTSDAREQRRLELAEEQAGLRGNRYQNKFDEARATRDATRFDQAMTGWADAPGLEAGGQRAERLLEDGAPVGAFADQRIAAGRIAGDFLGFLPGIPNREQVQQLEQLRLLGSQGALGDVSQLKGPLSEKELAFIQRLQIDPNATRETNMQVAEAMQWAARRQAAYGAAMERWVQELGSPSAPNANGLTFNAWWGQYASRALPRPGSPEAAARREDPVEAVPIAANGEGGDMGGGPGSTPDNPFDFTTASREEVIAAVQRGGWFRQGPDGQPYQLPPANPEFGTQEGDQMVAPGVAVRPQLGRDAEAQARVEEQSNVPGWWRNIEAAASAAAEQIPLLDEAAAWTAGQLSGVDYQSARNVQRDIADFDRENYRGARNAGGIAGGAALIATPLGAPVRVTRGATLAGRTANRAAGGALAGGAWGFGQGEGNALERLPETGTGAGFGAVAGPAAPVVGNALARGAAPVVRGAQAFNRAVARPIVNALGDRAPAELVEMVQPNPLASGIDRFARRSPQEVNALTANAERFRAETIEPTFADVVNDGGRGTMRALATRQTPARQAAREFAEGRAAGLQDRISTQARRTISDDPRSPMEIRDQAAEAGRRAAAPLYEQAYAQPIQISDEVTALLQTPAGQAAMQRAQRIAANERRAINLDEPDMQTLDYVKRGLDDVLEGYRDRTTGRMVLDTEGRAVQDVLTSFRNELDRINPTYAAARGAYADSARLQSAAELGERFMSMEADQFAAAVNRLSPQEREVARAAARRAVERQAGTQGQAPGVAQRLSTGREQTARTQALTGDAEPVQRAMGAELQALRNAQGISPAQGSPTSMNAQDAMNAAGLVRDAATLNVPGLASRAMNAIRSRGFSDQEAQAIVEAAIDPAQTNRLIDMLSERMSRREARNLARAVRYQLTTGPQSGQQQ